MIELRKSSKLLEALGFRVLSFGPRFLTGATAGFAALSGFYGLLGPFSDLSVIQLVADLERMQGEVHDDVPRPPVGRGSVATETPSNAKAASEAIDPGRKLQRVEVRRRASPDLHD